MPKLSITTTMTSDIYDILRAVSSERNRSMASIIHDALTVHFSNRPAKQAVTTEPDRPKQPITASIPEVAGVRVSDIPSLSPRFTGYTSLSGNQNDI